MKMKKLVLVVALAVAVILSFGLLASAEDSAATVGTSGLVPITIPGFYMDLGQPEDLLLKRLITTLEEAPFPDGTIKASKTLSVLFTLPGAVEEQSKSGATQEEILTKTMESSRPLFLFKQYPVAEYDAAIAAGDTPAKISGMETSEEFGRLEDIVYLYCQPAADGTDLSDANKTIYEAVVQQIPRMKAASVIWQAKPLSVLPAFSAKDLDGNAVDNTLFSRHKLTMINIWGTFCVPCIEEMPELSRLAQAMPDGTQLVGIVTDGEGNEAEAKQILAKTQATESFMQIIPDVGLLQFANSYLGVPTTLFVDAQGNLIGEAIVGSRSAEEYHQELSDRLASMD